MHLIETPTLVIYGELDKGVAKGMEFLARKISGADMVVVKEASHSPQWERPVEFNAALRRHLERNTAASAK